MAADVEPIAGTTALAAARLCNFATGAATLLPAHRVWLDGTVRPLVAAHPSAWVDLIGYASKLGDASANERLSQHRCGAVRTLVSSYSTTVSFPMEIGKGEAESTGGERDNDGRWRAVSVFVYASRPPAPPPAPPSTDPPEQIRRLVEAVGGLLRELERRFPLAGRARTALGIRAPTSARLLNADEQSLAFRTYGGSLDLTKIFISDGLGAQSRPFTAALEVSGLGWCVVLNLGDLGSWHARPRADTMIHELAHAWQSQHHSDRQRFMVNSLESQARAEADALLGRVGGWTSDPYYYVPGRPFREYAAEQIAQQVEDNFTGKTPGAGPITVHIASITPGTVDGFNVDSLAIARFERSTTPGVVT